MVNVFDSKFFRFPAKNQGVPARVRSKFTSINLAKNSDNEKTRQNDEL